MDKKSQDLAIGERPTLAAYGNGFLPTSLQWRYHLKERAFVNLDFSYDDYELLAQQSGDGGLRTYTDMRLFMFGGGYFFTSE